MFPNIFHNLQKFGFRLETYHMRWIIVLYSIFCGSQKDIKCKQIVRTFLSCLWFCDSLWEPWGPCWPGGHHIIHCLENGQKGGKKVLFSLLLFPQLSLPLHVRRLTWQGTTITSPGGFLDCVLSIYPDHEWAIAHKHVGWCHTMPGWVQKRQWEREEMSLLVVSTVTQELQIVGVHLQLCCSMWKSLQAPDFYGSCGKMQSQRYESSMGRQHVCCYSSKKPLFLPPPLVLLAAYSRKLPGMEQSSHALSLILPSSSVGK